MHQNARTRLTGAVCALLLVTTTAGAQGFSCLDVCTNTFGDDIIVNGSRYVLVECSAIYHNGHHHVDCTYAR